MKNSIVTRFLDIVLIVAIIITVILMIWLPFIVGAFMKVMSLDLSNNFMLYAMIIIGYLLAIPYLGSLVKLKKLTKLILKKEAFSEKAVKALKLISIFAFLEFIIFIASSNFLKYGFTDFRSILLVGPTILLGFILITIGCLFAVLAALFRNAMEIKLENDMTI